MAFATLKDLLDHQRDQPWHRNHEKERLELLRRFQPIENVYEGLHGRQLKANRLLFNRYKRFEIIESLVCGCNWLFLLSHHPKIRLNSFIRVSTLYSESCIPYHVSRIVFSIFRIDSFQIFLFS